MGVWLTRRVGKICTYIHTYAHVYTAHNTLLLVTVSRCTAVYGGGELEEESLSK